MPTRRKRLAGRADAMQAASPYYSLGIDIGGTFTDLVVYDEERGSYRSHKELTTPQDPTEGVIAGLRHPFEREQVALGNRDFFLNKPHGIGASRNKRIPLSEKALPNWNDS
jgi:hypothetical protein